jgi:hypothetical protein
MLRIERPQPGVWQITARPSAIKGWKFVHHVHSLLFFATLLYAALLLFPTYYLPIRADLDSSWAFGLNYFAHSEVKFGPDLIFTYGPLGYIATPMNVGSNIATAMLARWLLWGVLLWQLTQIRLSGKHLAAWALVISLILSNRLYFYYWDYFLAATILILCYRLVVDTPRRLELGILALLTGVSFLVKASVFIMAISLVFVLLVPRPSTFRRYLWISLVLASGPIAYLLYNPSLSGLVLYIKGTLETASGYAAWMSLPTDATLAIRAFILAGAVIGCAAYAVWTRALRLPPAGLAVVALLIVFRHGFIRSEAGHAAVFYAFSILTLGVVLASVSFTRWNALIYGAVFCAFSFIALQGVSARWRVWGSFWWSPRVKLTEAESLWRWDRTVAWLDAVSKDSLASTVIDPYAADIRGSRVLVFPWDLSFAAYHEFKLFPLYAMQAYSAYTRYLDRKSAERIRSADLRIDTVIFEWQSIDGRHPLLDTPATWNALFDEYVPRAVRGDSILLERRAHSVQASYRPLYRADFDPDAWISVPRRPTLVGVSIDLKPTAIGALFTAAYKLPPVFIELRTLSGAATFFRVPVDVLATPFAINCLPTSFNQLLGLWSKNECSDPVVELGLTGDGLAYMRRSSWQFYDVAGTSISVGGGQQAGSEASSEGTVTIDARVSRGSRFIVYCNDAWTSPQALPVTPGQWKTYKFRVPLALKSLRFDPTELAGADIEIRSVKFDYTGRPSRWMPFIDLPKWIQYHSMTTLNRHGVGARIHSTDKDMFIMSTVDVNDYLLEPPK